MKQFSRQFIVTLQAVLRILNPKERIVFGVLTLLSFIGMLGTLGTLYRATTVPTPTYGGTLTEGSVGTPRFINPLLALSSSDQDLTRLVYSGLLRQEVNGDFTPDLAESVTISENGLTYTFTLKENVTFHDGTPVTSADVVFTIEKAQEPALRSPLRVQWEGVQVTAIDERTVQFVLPQKYTAFLENASIGILPQHIWSTVTTDQFNFSTYNSRPIGSGPYRIESIKEDKLGIPTSYTLRSFKDFALGRPHIKTLVIRFYPNQNELLDAFKKGAIDAASSVTPTEDNASVFNKQNTRIITAPLPRVFGIFLNKTKNPLLTDNELLAAIENGINKKHIIDRVLGGYGESIDGPVPPRLSSATSNGWNEANRTAAQATLDRKGWIVNTETGIREKTIDGKVTPLSFTMATNNTPDLQNVAEILREDFAYLGIGLDVQYYETGILDQDIIRPRAFEMLLFGNIVEHESNLFAFWHSTQRNDPGLNITLYSNPTVDRNLTSILTELDFKKRSQLVDAVDAQITRDRAAIFLYTPDFIYLTKNTIHNIRLGDIVRPSDRFNQVHTWYRATDRVWPIFLK